LGTPATVGGSYKADETNFKKKDNAETAEFAEVRGEFA